MDICRDSGTMLPYSTIIMRDQKEGKIRGDETSVAPISHALMGSVDNRGEVAHMRHFHLLPSVSTPLLGTPPAVPVLSPIEALRLYPDRCFRVVTQ